MLPTLTIAPAANAQRAIHLDVDVPANAEPSLTVEQGVGGFFVAFVRRERETFVVAGDAVIADHAAVAFGVQIAFAVQLVQEVVFVEAQAAPYTSRCGR